MPRTQPEVSRTAQLLSAPAGDALPEPALRQGSTPWRGVNLGGWLLLERWMQESLFEGTEARDEFGLCTDLGSRAAGHLRRHQESYINRDDLRWLKATGINAVRLPVGFWLFTPESPFVRCADLVEACLEWASEFGLDVVLDLHGLPGGQSPEHHTGHAGEFRWHRNASHRDRSLDVLEELAASFARHRSLAAIQVINEPDPGIPSQLLLDFYRDAYERVRRHCLPSRVAVVVTAFPEHRLPELHGKLGRPDFENVVTDLHYYQCFGEPWQARGLADHLDAPLRIRLPEIERATRKGPVIVGEWSLRLPWSPRDWGRELDPFRQGLLMRAFGATQLAAYDRSAGWFFWTYRAEKEPEWSFRDAIDREWLPGDFNELPVGA